jgi:curli production assembly/transport component CsgF
MKRLVVALAAGTIGLLAAASASGSQLVYHPANPTFGGNPLNGTYLLQQAQAQGNGLKSSADSPDLSGLSNALSGIGSGTSPIVVIGGSGSSGTGGSGTGSGMP